MTRLVGWWIVALNAHNAAAAALLGSSGLAAFSAGVALLLAAYIPHADRQDLP